MRQQYRNTEKKGKTVPKTQYQPKSSSQSQMLSQNLSKFGTVTRNLLGSMIEVGWDYILAAKIFHPKRKSQHRLSMGGYARLEFELPSHEQCAFLIFYFWLCFRLHCGWLSTQARQGQLSARV